MILIYDTETDGLVHGDLPPEHPLQPHLVQLGCVLADDDGRERAAVSLIVRPEGWAIPEAAFRAHGISTEEAVRCGVPHAVAVAAFTQLRALADTLAVHNAPFDRLVMAAAIARTGRQSASPGPLRHLCTMQMAAPIVNLPPTDRMRAAGFTKPKPPSLSEAYRAFFGEELVGAHDALVDARACARILFHMRALEAQTA